MIIKTLLVTALLATSPITQAKDASVGDLARLTGLSERNVRMIVGDRTAHADYRCCYERKLKQFKEAVGEENYQRLVNGKPMLLDATHTGDRRNAAAGEMEAARSNSAP